MTGGVANLCQILGEDRDLGPLSQLPHPTPDRHCPYTIQGVVTASKRGRHGNLDAFQAMHEGKPQGVPKLLLTLSPQQTAEQ